MSRFAVGALSTGAGSTTLPVGSLYSATTVMPRIREVGVYNTTATACAVKLARLSTAGTKGSGLTVAALSAADPATVASTGFQTHTVAPTATDLGYRAQLGAAVGSGQIWTFDDWELTLAASATAGLGILVESGTGQVLEWYISWIE